MTNKEHWLNYTSAIPSPQKYIDWGWLYLISASLQRRVWLSASHQPCFSNMYQIWVGPPGVGKGIGMKPVSDVLKHWKLGENGSALTCVTPEQQAAFDAVAEQDLEKATENENKVKSSDIIKPFLFPIAPDATTYEALVQSVSESFRRCNYDKWNEKLQKFTPGVYGHSSVSFILPELNSLLRKKTDDTVNYLLGIYDCPEDYNYKTKNKGEDRVRRGCLNILAATQPDFISSIMDDKLVSQGFTSRVFFLFANKNRHNSFFLPDLTPDQEESKKVILEHVKKLSLLYGQASIDAATGKFLQEWWNDIENAKEKRANHSLKLIPYYARKNIHIMKVAMAMHFGESTEKFIPMETFQNAIDFLHEEEKSMHLALIEESDNPLAKVSKRIMEFLRSGRKNWVELAIEANGIADKKMLQEALDYLLETQQIKMEIVEDPHTKAEVLHWKVV